MELTNEFRVELPAERAWEVLTDIERIAPCMPGAELQEVGDDGSYRGVVRVKVGPITAQYKGEAKFVERDDAAYRAVLRADGRETRGQGNASATVTAQLAPDGEITVVTVVTDLKISGRVAQFGRGVLADVSTKLLEQFSSCLAERLVEGSTDSDNHDSDSRTVPAPPVDLLDTAAVPIAKRIVGVAAVAAALLWVVRRLRRSRR